MAVWNNDTTFKFLELYQIEPAIWDPQNKNHKDKAKVNDAWVRISKIMDIEVSELKKKKESLMACFRGQLNKKKASIKSGAGVDDVYKPIWIYYDVMEGFLGSMYDCGVTINTQNNTQGPLATDKENQEVGVSCASNLSSEHSSVPLQTPSRFKKQGHRTSNPELQEAGKQMQQAFSTLQNVLTQRSKKEETEDECDLYAKLLAKKIRKFPEDEREELMYAIDGMLLQRLRNSKRQKLDSSSSSPNTRFSTQSVVSSPMTSPSCSVSSPMQIQHPNHYTMFTNEDISIISPREFDISNEPSSEICTTQDYNKPSTSKIKLLSQEIYIPRNTNIIGQAYSRTFIEEERNNGNMQHY